MSFEATAHLRVGAIVPVPFSYVSIRVIT